MLSLSFIVFAVLCSPSPSPSNPRILRTLAHESQVPNRTWASLALRSSQYHTMILFWPISALSPLWSFSDFMGGSVEDLGAPDSWEVADLDETMSRLMLSSKKDRDSKAQEQLDDCSPSTFSAPPPAPSPPASGNLSEDVINQVDQFLREALQNPRERLSSKFFFCRVALYVRIFGCFYSVRELSIPFGTLDATIKLWCSAICDR